MENNQSKIVKEPENENALAKAEPPAQIEIKNLVVSPLPMKHILLGDPEGLVKMVGNRDDVEGILWSEGAICVMVDGNTQLTFKPELYPQAQMFFGREEKRRNMYDEDAGVRVWEGEFEPVQFLKKHFLKFLEKYSNQIPEEVVKAIKKLRVTEKREEKSEMLDLEGDRSVTTEYEEKSTNLPREFTLEIPISHNFVGELHFEATVKKKTDTYGHEKKGKIIEVRCTNAREVLRDMMKNIVNQLPENIPRYYGALRVESQK